MPQEFKAIVRETHDNSQWIDREDTRTGEVKQELWFRSARFLLEPSEPFPWPPSQLAGKVVRVIVED